MSVDFSEYAMIDITVTTAGGIISLEGVEVTVIYNYIGGEVIEETRVTDREGKTGVFKLPVKRAVIGGKRVDFPRRAECSIKISASGYVPLLVRGVHLFPDVTVKSCFDIISSKKEKRAWAY